MQLISWFAVNKKLTLGLQLRTLPRAVSLCCFHQCCQVWLIVEFGRCRALNQPEHDHSIRVRVLSHWHSHNCASCGIQCTPKIQQKSGHKKLFFCFLHFLTLTCCFFPKLHFHNTISFQTKLTNQHLKQLRNTCQQAWPSVKAVERHWSASLTQGKPQFVFSQTQLSLHWKALRKIAHP